MSAHGKMTSANVLTGRSDWGGLMRRSLIAANCSVVYEAAVGGSKRPRQRGLDVWQLMFWESRWSVVSVVNESEVAAGPVPESVYGD